MVHGIRVLKSQRHKKRGQQDCDQSQRRDERSTPEPLLDSTEQRGASGLNGATIQKSLQVCRQVRGGGIPIHRSFLQAFQNDPAEILADVRIYNVRRNCFEFFNLSQRVCDRRRTERWMPDHKIMEHSSKCINIGRRTCGIDIMRQLLRRHKLWCAKHGTRDGIRLRLCHQASQSEIPEPRQNGNSLSPEVRSGKSRMLPGLMSR